MLQYCRETFLDFWISQLWLHGLAWFLEVLHRDLTGDVREGILRMFLLGEPLEGTSGREVWEKFRCGFMSNLSDFSILLTEFRT